jgi:ubiquinol-cytochrome c reductase cytochrome b subunit
VIGMLYDWLDHRIGHRKLLDVMLLEHIPGGARWRYVWGSALAFVFTIQLITGILLMTAYSPSDTSAWGSVYFIQYEMDFGWLIRGLHHFGSQTMVVLLGVHMLQVVIAGAHLPPREVNWWLGVALMGVTLGLSLTGYLLPWDQKGFFATQVATNIAGGIPGIGESIQKILLGGPTYGNHTLSRFFTLHVWILPATLVALVVCHLALFRRHGVTHPKVKPIDAPRHVGLAMIRDLILGGIASAACYTFGVPTVTCGVIAAIFVMFAVSRLLIAPVETGWFWPDQAFRDLLVCLMIFGVMLSLVLYSGHGNKLEAEPAAEGHAPGIYERWAHAGKDGLGANLDAPADPDTEGYPARPEWYFLFLFQLLKYFTGDQMLIGTVVIPNGAFVLLLLLPLFGFGRMRTFGHVLGILVVVGLLAGAGALTVLALQSDSPKPVLPYDVIKLSDEDRKKAVSFEHRVHVAHEEAERAVQLASQGIPLEGAREMMRRDPVLRGPKLFETNCASCHTYTPADPKKDPVKFNNPELKYKAGDLADYASEKWIRGLLTKPSDDAYFGRTHLNDTKHNGMVKWRSKLEKERKGMEKDDIAKQEAEHDLIAKFLAQQGRPVKDRDEKVEKAGLDAFNDNCATCHKMNEPGPSSGPNLTGYGSQEWLRLMIMAPDHVTRYGTRNKMPAFRNFDSIAFDVDKLLFDDQFNPPDADGKKPPPRPMMNLPDASREVLIRWLTHDHRAVFGGTEISGPAKK